MGLGQIHNEPNRSVLFGGTAYGGAVGQRERWVGEWARCVSARYFFIDSLLYCVFVLERGFEVARSRLCALAREPNIKAIAQPVNYVVDKAPIRVFAQQFLEQIDIYNTLFVRG